MPVRAGDFRRLLVREADAPGRERLALEALERAVRVGRARLVEPRHHHALVGLGVAYDVGGQAPGGALARVVAGSEAERIAAGARVGHAEVVHRARTASSALGAEDRQIRLLAAALRVAHAPDLADGRRLADLVATSLGRDAHAR